MTMQLIVNENVIEAVEVPVVETVQNEVVENNVADNAEDKPRQERQRRTPRHLRTSNNQRRRRNEMKSPMPLFAAVASPELASGKVCIDYSAVNAPKENNFLSVDELLEQEKTKKRCDHPATGIVVEEKSVEAQPALDFITQPANEAVQQKVQESLERLIINQNQLLKLQRQKLNFKKKLSLLVLMCSQVVQVPFQQYSTQKQR